MRATSELYIYYRIMPGAEPELLPRLRAMQRTVATEFGCRARLAEKCGEAMLMEVYEGVDRPDELLARIDALFAEFADPAWLAPGATRHTEHFRCV